MIVYHGSGVEVKQPRIIINPRVFRDFGYGFYCTSNKNQAIRWALNKNQHHVVNHYLYNEKHNLSVRKFNHIDREWLNFIASCRVGVSHKFDIVEGPMADDQVWNFAEGYLEGEISEEEFKYRCQFTRKTHQICFCTEKSLESIYFERSEFI